MDGQQRIGMWNGMNPAAVLQEVRNSSAPVKVHGLKVWGQPMLAALLALAMLFAFSAMPRMAATW